MKQTLYSQIGLSAQNIIPRASVAAGMVDSQKHMRHLNIEGEIYKNAH